MGRARVVVDVAPTQSVGDALSVDGARLQRSGIDRVEFLIAPNKGEDPRPLRRIASGGELSRALLALKRVLADRGPAGLYVFDEVDAGVGGAVAEVIGRAIADIARHRQVLCITHLPQIAALATTHFVVGKTEAKGRTSSTSRRLRRGRTNRRTRPDEIGGVKVGEAAKRAAVDMMRARTPEPREAHPITAPSQRAGGVGGRQRPGSTSPRPSLASLGLPRVLGRALLPCGIRSGDQFSRAFSRRRTPSICSRSTVLRKAFRGA